MSVLAGRDAEVLLNAILKSPHFGGVEGDPYRRPWRGFIDGHWAVLEPPYVSITMEDMRALESFHVDHVGAVFRTTPHVGVYLRCRMLDPRTPR